MGSYPDVCSILSVYWAGQLTKNIEYNYRIPKQFESRTEPIYVIHAV